MMTGSDDHMMDRRPSSNTPAIALTAAAVLLLVVGGISYKDYVDRGREKEVDEMKEQLKQELMAQYGTPQAGVGAAALQGDGSDSARDGNGPAFGERAESPESSPAPPPDPSRLPGDADLPAPNDPLVSQVEDSLERARRQAAETERNYRELSGTDEAAGLGASTGPGASSALEDSLPTEGIGDLNEELPAFLRESSDAPPEEDPEVAARVARLEEQVRLAPAIGTVVSYEKDWGLVTFNAGSINQVRKGQRFAVRRGGTDILGWIRVEVVEEARSVGVLVTKNRSSDTALKPQPGDDLIQFEYPEVAEDL